MLRKLVGLLAVDLMNLDFLKICMLCETVVCNGILVRKKAFPALEIFVMPLARVISVVCCWR